MQIINSDVNTKISVGNYELIDGGYIISPNGEQISINLDDLTVDFDFRYDGGETEIETNIISEKDLRLTLYNHGGGVIMGGVSPSVGPTDPLSIGEFDDHELLLMYRVKTEYVENDPSTVAFFYNFYQGDKKRDSRPNTEGDEHVGE